MLGERSGRRGLWEAARLYPDHLGPDFFHGLAASSWGRLFRDSEFAEFSCAEKGREGVTPGLLWWQALALFYGRLEFKVELLHGARKGRWARRVRVVR